jgi:hypothetical protein
MLLGISAPRCFHMGYALPLGIYLIVALNLGSLSMGNMPTPQVFFHRTSRAKGSPRLRGKTRKAVALLLVFISLLGVYAVTLKQILFFCGRCPHPGPVFHPFCHSENPIQGPALHGQVAIPLSAPIPLNSDVPINCNSSSTFVWELGRYASLLSAFPLYTVLYTPVTTRMVHPRLCCLFSTSAAALPFVALWNFYVPQTQGLRRSICAQ